MTRLLSAIASLLFLVVIANSQVLDARKSSNPHVIYVSPETLKKYPVPVLDYLHDREKYGSMKAKIEETIIYPFLDKSREPVAAIIVDFCPDIVNTIGEDRRGCEEDRGNLVIGVTVHWHNGSRFLSLIERNGQGGFDKDAYLTLFPEAYKEQSDSAPLIKPRSKARKN